MSKSKQQPFWAWGDAMNRHPIVVMVFLSVCVMWIGIVAASVMLFVTEGPPAVQGAESRPD